jgi:hypothetical protein
MLYNFQSPATGSMKLTVTVDDKKLFLNPFMITLTANLLDAIARSLKAPDGNRVELTLDGDQLRLAVDEQEVPLNLGHAQQIIGNVIHGLTRSLHGAEGGTKFIFISDQSHEPAASVEVLE